MLALTFPEFKNWLEALPPCNVAGDKGEPTSCPIARFLKTKTDAEIYVHADRFKLVSRDSQGKKVEEIGHLPNWAIRFVDGLDGLDTSTPFITAKEALGLLEKARVL